MDIGLLNERVTFQKNEIISDKIGNRKRKWVDYYECACTIGGESLKKMEEDENAVTEDVSEMTVTIRYCLTADTIDSTHYRVIFQGETYDIIAVDHQNFKKKSLKFRCRRERNADDKG